MPIQLDSSIGIGELGDALTHIKVTQFNCDLTNKVMKMKIEYGWLDGESNFLPSSAKPPEYHILENVPTVGSPGDSNYQEGHTQFNDEVGSHTSNNGELTYDAVARGLYEWLIAEGHYVGTIV